jgi:hypothetical protein
MRDTAWQEDFGFQGMGDVLMRSEILSVVESDGVHEIALVRL